MGYWKTMDHGSMYSWITGLGKYRLIVIALHHLECGIKESLISYYTSISSHLDATKYRMEPFIRLPSNEWGQLIFEDFQMFTQEH